jgi:hypothetical protein
MPIAPMRAQSTPTGVSVAELVAGAFLMTVGIR